MGAGQGHEVTRPSCVHIYDGAPAYLAFQYPSGNGRHLCQANHLGGAGQLAQIKVLGKPRPCLQAHRLRSIDRIDTGQGHVAQNERQHRARQIRALGQAEGSDNAAILGVCQGIGQGVAAHRINDAGPALLGDWRARLIQQIKDAKYVADELAPFIAMLAA